MATKEAKRKNIILYKSLFFSFLAFMLGIIVARGLYSGSAEMIVISVALFLLAMILTFLDKKFVRFFLLVCLFFAGNGFYFLGMKSFDVKSYSQPVTVQGRVGDHVEDYQYGYQVILDDVKINGQKGKNISLQISNCYGEVKTGDILSFSCMLTTQKPFIVQDFNSYAYRNGTRYSAEVNFSDINITKGYTKFDEKVRIKVKDLLSKNFSQKNAGVAYSLLFGDKTDLDEGIKEAFVSTGIIHILTVSGLHVSFLLAIFYTFLRKIKVNKYICASLTTILIIFYLYLCSFTPAVTRAGIMAIVFMFAKTFRKRYDSLSSLGFAGFLICFISPLTPFDLGFVMSFFSVFAIVSLIQIFTKFFKKFLPYKISGLISLTLAAQLGVFPSLASMGGSVNLLSFMINMLIVPIFSVIFPYIFVISFLSAIMPFLSYLLYPINYIFNIIYIIVNFFSQSQLIIPIPQSHLGVTIIFLLIILAASGILYVSSLKKLAVFTALVLTAVFSFGLYSIPKKENSFVAYLSTGSTYSLVFNSKNSDKILVGIDGNILRYNKNFDSGGYSCVLTLDKPRDYQMDYLSEINYGSLISYQNPNKTEKITEVSTNTDLQIGDFSFNFIENNDNIMGILIVMDNVKYFVATALYECYDLYYQTLDILKPQVVFAGFLDELAKNDEYFCITQSKVQGAECSFESDGDMILRMNKNKLLRRCID